jgi:type 1 fimbria pilin
MNPSDNKVSLEIPLNTQMKIFAFLFKQDYTKSQLFSGVREVGYYGQSQPFSIGTNTNSLSLGITLQSAGTTTGGGTLSTAPTVTFSPANGANGVAISGNITITFSEAVRSIDNTVLTDSNINSHITLKLNNASGSNINFDATINTDKTVITINPASNLYHSQAVYVAIGATYTA